MLRTVTQCKISGDSRETFSAISMFLPQKVHEWRVHVTSALLLHSRDPFNNVEKKPGGNEATRRIGRIPMEVSRDIARFACSRPVIECAQCGERIYIPEWSECVDGCRVRHLWRCDACGTSFETSVCFGWHNPRYRASPKLHLSRNFAQRKNACTLYSGMIDRDSPGARSPLGGISSRAAQATSMTAITAYAFAFKGLDGDDPVVLVCGPSRAGGQHRVALRVHPAICRPADALDALPRPWPYHPRRTFQRFRRSGAGGRATSTAPTRPNHGTFPMAEKVSVKGKDAHPFYEWADGRARARSTTVESPQIPDRAGRVSEGGLQFGHRTDRPDRCCGDQIGIDSSLTRVDQDRSCCHISEKFD